MEYSGFQFAVSECNFEDHEGQFRDAVGFLEQHKDAIRAITQRSDVTHALLDFGFTKDQSLVFWRHIPKELVAVAGECGVSIMLSFY